MIDKSYKMYLEEKFTGLHALVHANFIEVHERLDKIEVQTTKTNGRVTSLEGKVDMVERDLLMHPINCTQSAKIDNISKDVENIKGNIEGRRDTSEGFFKKYSATIATLTVLLMMGTFIITCSKQASWMEKINYKMDQQSSTLIMRGDKYDPFVNDTINRR